MLLSLVRENPLDRVFTCEDLRTLAQLLLTACEEAGLGPPQIGLTATVWGFLRSEGEALRARVAAGLGVRASLRDPDTLEITRTFQELPRESAPDLLKKDLEQLSSLLDGRLLLELRLRFALPGEPEERAYVLHGVLEAGTFTLQGLWRKEYGDFPEQLNEHAPWILEGKLLGLLDEQARNAGKIDFATASEWFPSRSALAFGGTFSWLLNYTTIAEWFQRVAVCGGLFSGFSVLLLVSFHLSLGLLAKFALGIGLAFSGLALLFSLGYRLVLVYLFHKKMLEMNKLAYSNPLAVEHIDLSQDTVAQRDIAMRKFTLDMEALGASRVEDTDWIFPVAEGTFNRAFLTDDGTVVFLIFLRQVNQSPVRPFKTNFLIRTELENGARCVTLNDNGGYCKPLPGLDLVERVFTRAKHPAELLKKHRHVLQLTEQKRGLRRRKLSAQEVLESESAYHEQLRVAKRQVGYFGWSDAFRMSFQASLPEYQKDEID